jgi:hypothetical protein
MRCYVCHQLLFGLVYGWIDMFWLKRSAFPSRNPLTPEPLTGLIQSAFICICTESKGSRRTRKYYKADILS